MDRMLVLKAIADETRMNILTLLLRHNYCVGALAKELELSESAISQHLKVLREAGLLIGEKRGYFMHYDVNREVLRELAADFEELAALEREACSPESGVCRPQEEPCPKQDCSDEVREFCHGPDFNKEEKGPHGHCSCHKSE